MITGISSPIGLAAGGTTVTLTGTNFTGTTAVSPLSTSANTGNSAFGAPTTDILGVARPGGAVDRGAYERVP